MNPRSILQIFGLAICVAAPAAHGLTPSPLVRSIYYSPYGLSLLALGYDYAVDMIQKSGATPEDPFPQLYVDAFTQELSHHPCITAHGLAGLYRALESGHGCELFLHVPGVSWLMKARQTASVRDAVIGAVSLYAYLVSLGEREEVEKMGGSYSFIPGAPETPVASCAFIAGWPQCAYQAATLMTRGVMADICKSITLERFWAGVAENGMHDPTTGEIKNAHASPAAHAVAAYCGERVHIFVESARSRQAVECDDDVQLNICITDIDKAVVGNSDVCDQSTTHDRTTVVRYAVVENGNLYAQAQG